MAITRRNFLKSGVALGGGLALAGLLPSWTPRLAFAQPYNNPRGDVLISIFLRGGADALNMIVPHADDTYYSARPRLNIPRPDANGADPKAVDLDGYFGLHPSLAGLRPLFQASQMVAVHAVGSTYETRSHFEAMTTIERGTPGSYEMNSGWIGRHLAQLGSDEHTSPIRGIGWGTSVQETLLGAPSTVAMRSIIDYHLDGNEQLANQMMQSLMGLYTLEAGPLAVTAEATQQAIDLVQRIGYEQYIPRNSATYPETEFAMALRQTAALIRADVGLEAACIDLGGWDTHANQGGTQGTQANLMAGLAAGLAAFNQDMGAEMSGVTVVVMSEFGRRVQENASQGTDHGRAGAMYIMSGQLATQDPVVARWPSLAPDALDAGDLAVTMDYRDVLAEILTKRLQTPDIAAVFPNHTPEAVGVF